MVEDRQVIKLALGTAQFGLDYGISNSQGQVNIENSQDILRGAIENGITTLDTSHNYGNSELVIGGSNLAGSFDIITKVPNVPVDSISQQLQRSLSRLGVSELYGYLLHDFEMFRKSPDTWGEMLKIKQQGTCKKIGFSLYEIEDLELLLEKQIPFDLIQIPYNVLDRRFEPYFKILHNQHIEIHIRSVFLQGLLFLTMDNLPKFFSPLSRKILRFQSFASALRLSVAELCLAFVHYNSYVDKIVIGVTTAEELGDNIKALQKSPYNQEIHDCMQEFQEYEKRFLIPMNWQI